MTFSSSLHLDTWPGPCGELFFRRLHWKIIYQIKRIQSFLMTLFGYGSILSILKFRYPQQKTLVMVDQICHGSISSNKPSVDKQTRYPQLGLMCSNRMSPSSLHHLFLHLGFSRHLEPITHCSSDCLKPMTHVFFPPQGLEHSMPNMHPRKLTWNLKMSPWKRRLL